MNRFRVLEQMDRLQKVFLPFPDRAFPLEIHDRPTSVQGVPVAFSLPLSGIVACHRTCCPERILHTSRAANRDLSREQTLLLDLLPVIARNHGKTARQDGRPRVPDRKRICPTKIAYARKRSIFAAPAPVYSN